MLCGIEVWADVGGRGSRAWRDTGQQPCRDPGGLSRSQARIDKRLPYPSNLPVELLEYYSV